jgi:hypothetical protein
MFHDRLAAIPEQAARRFALELPLIGRIDMFGNRKIPRTKLQIINSPMKPPGKKLTGEDIARLNERRAELVIMLRGWHGYGRARAESEINLWLNDHI